MRQINELQLENTKLIKSVARNLFACALVILTIPAQALTVAEVAKLLPLQGDPGDFFGISVAVSGDTAIVGAEGDDDVGESSGSASIFVRSAGGSWIHQKKLTAPDASAGDRFGEWVAIDGDTAVVGALDDKDNGVMSGAVYVFTRTTGASWKLQGKLLASDGESGDRFGETVYIDGDTIGVGARFADAQMGSAYIFTRTDGAWTEQQKLTAPVRNARDWFGTQVAVSGDTAVVGARTEDATNIDSGAAHVFTRSGGVWSIEATLAADGDAGDEFGMAVDIDGDTAAVSAFKDDDNGMNSGSVYVFTRSGTIWSQQQKILADDDIPGFDELGTQLVLQGDNLLVGGSLTRAAFLFTRSEGSWTQQAKITTDDKFAARLGTSVGLDGNTVVAGARLSIDNGTQSGSAFVFEILSDDIVACLKDLAATVMSINLQQGIDNALDAKLEAILFALDDASNSDAIQATNMLVAFIQNVEAQRGFHLTDDQADTLIDSAQACIDLIGN